MTQNSINNTASILTVDNLQLDGNTLSSTDTNGNIVLAPDGSGTVSVTTAPIVPSGDRADSLGSNTNSWDNVYADGLTFDDGTNILSSYTATTSWTPALEFGGASTGITYSSQLGSYTRIGNLCIVYVNIELSNKGSAAGAATITGFPLTYSSVRQGFGVGRYTALNLTANFTQVGIMCFASPTFTIIESGDNVTAQGIADTQFSNSSVISFTGALIVNT